MTAAPPAAKQKPGKSAFGPPPQPKHTVPEITDNLEPESEQVAMFDIAPGEAAGNLSLSSRFVFPPFSILDARQGAWQDRKREWIRRGLRSGDGRDARMLAKSVSDEWIEDASAPGGGYFKGAPPGSVNAKILSQSNGQSIFDPVLCEMFVRWFCPPEGRILDPYAGGSVRGLVSAVTKRYYDGIDLSGSQVTANEAQADEWLAAKRFEPEFMPTWHQGDSWASLAPGNDAVVDDGPYDFVWSCPPYHDLEVYSDHPDDQSNMPWEDFCTRYRETIEGAVDRLAPDRFAGFVIGEFRHGKEGYYRNFMGLTVDAFEAAGASYYNECIYISPAGTLVLRTGKQFVVSRKMGRTHQTVLIFCKGDPRKAAAACHEQGTLQAALGSLGQTVASIDAAPDEEEV